jgi:hypothetical protein
MVSTYRNRAQDIRGDLEVAMGNTTPTSRLAGPRGVTDGVPIHYSLALNP